MPEQTTMRIVRVVTNDIFIGDAVGNFCRQIRDFLQRAGIETVLYARNFDAEITPDIRPYIAIVEECAAGDVLFVNHSIYDPGLEHLAGLDASKIVYYHGITPPDYFLNYDSRTWEYCQRGLAQFKLFADYDCFAANSGYMLNELINGVCGMDQGCMDRAEASGRTFPPFIITAGNESEDCVDTEPVEIPEAEYPLLYVGRLAPHKCVHELLSITERLTSEGLDVSLLIVGASGSEVYLNEIMGLLHERYIGVSDRIRIYGHVSNAELAWLYANAWAFITMSAHEGYCVPVVEAIRHGLPVIAKNAGAVPETLSGAGILVESPEDPELYSKIFKLTDITYYENQVNNQRNVYSAIRMLANGRALIDVIQHVSVA